MHRLREKAIEDDRPSPRRRFIWIILGLVLLGLAGGVWLVFVRDSGPAGPPAPTLEALIEGPVSGTVVATQWSSPSALAVDGDRIHVLDTGNNRILTMDRQGVVDRILCETGECAFLLDAPQDMHVRDGLIYVANTEQGEVVVLDDAGTLVQTYELPAEVAGSARATGVYVADDGLVYASDWVSGRVAVFEPGGAFRHYFGADTVGEFEFIEPAGLLVDSGGNLFVAEHGLGRVRKISPEGRELAEFTMIPGATAVSEATDVASADNGLFYMSDNKRSVVHVFTEAARYVGIVGLIDASRRDSPGALLRPHGLAVDGDQLYIIDQRRGLLIYAIDPDYFLLERHS